MAKCPTGPLRPENMRSLAVLKAARERERARREALNPKPEPVVLDIALPDRIRLGQLAALMGARVADVVKALIRRGEFLRAHDEIDYETAESIVEEFGHKPRRAES
ncbi:translation initiation factor IF-2 N-terminal domain-containing protein [Henriciella sp. AS95]|uniref:translation initiation factor IF-2 N-terminal domain-containing protein n=1 Tax=Henriciella sp. AS95 TaxID=3135782 RepID=UPI003176748D